MKLHLSDTAGVNRITSYGADFVTVNAVRYQCSLIVTAHSVDTHWRVTDPAALATAHVAHLIASQPEVVLLGTGTRCRFPAPEVLRPLIDAGIGYEVMDTGAACRTYEVLTAEGRKVVAALVLG